MTTRIEVSLIKAMFGWKFSATIAGTVFQSTGDTEEEAVGKLVILHGDKINLLVIKD